MSGPHLGTHKIKMNGGWVKGWVEIDMIKQIE